MKETRLYRIWERFIQGKPAACEEWRHNPAAFIAWAKAHGYRDNTLLLRYRKDKGYSPENCHWEAKRNQGQGRRAKHYITHNGKTRSAAEWARITGINYHTILYRLAGGRTPEEILKTK